MYFLQLLVYIVFSCCYYSTILHSYYQQDYVDAALNTVMQIYKNTPDGDGSDVLVFLTGQDEIEDLASLLKRYLEDLEPDNEVDRSSFLSNQITRMEEYDNSKRQDENYSGDVKVSNTVNFFKWLSQGDKIIKQIKKFILEVGENIWKSVESGFFPFGY